MMNKKSDEIRKQARKMETLAQIYDHLLNMRNNSYGQIDSIDDDHEEFKAWDGMEVEFDTVNEVLEMIMKLAK